MSGKRANCVRYKVECCLCSEIFDNDYDKKHTALRHPDYEKQLRIVPTRDIGVKKRKSPWEAQSPEKVVKECTKNNGK